jgi:hypothetical protein
VRICEEALAKVFSEEFEGGVPKELEDDKFEDSGSWGGITEDGLEEGKGVGMRDGVVVLVRIGGAGERRGEDIHEVLLSVSEGPWGDK